MHKTTLLIDEKKVARAKRFLGTRGIRDTIDRALDEVLALEARRQALASLRSLEGLDLDKPAVMRRAWR